MSSNCTSSFSSLLNPEQIAELARKVNENRLRKETGDKVESDRRESLRKYKTRNDVSDSDDSDSQISKSKKKKKSLGKNKANKTETDISTNDTNVSAPHNAVSLRDIFDVFGTNSSSNATGDGKRKSRAKKSGQTPDSDSVEYTPKQVSIPSGIDLNIDHILSNITEDQMFLVANLFANGTVLDSHRERVCFIKYEIYRNIKAHFSFIERAFLYFLYLFPSYYTNLPPYKDFPLPFIYRRTKGTQPIVISQQLHCTGFDIIAKKNVLQMGTASDEPNNKQTDVLGSDNCYYHFIGSFFSPFNELMPPLPIKVEDKEVLPHTYGGNVNFYQIKLKKGKCRIVLPYRFKDELCWFVIQQCEIKDNHEVVSEMSTKWVPSDKYVGVKFTCECEACPIREFVETVHKSGCVKCPKCGVIKTLREIEIIGNVDPRKGDTIAFLSDFCSRMCDIPDISSNWSKILFSESSLIDTSGIQTSVRTLPSTPHEYLASYDSVCSLDK